MSATIFHGFQDLPIELRAHVICYCLPNQRTITARTHINAYGYAAVNLRLVSKDVCALVAQVYYHENTFLIARSHVTGALASKVYVPHPGISAHIRKLDLRIYLGANIETPLDLCVYNDRKDSDDANEPRGPFRPSDLLSLMRPNGCTETSSTLTIPWIGPAAIVELDERVAWRVFESLGQRMLPKHRHRLTHWQKHFVGLNQLEVTIVTNGCLGVEARKILEELVRSSRTFLHAKEVEIVVRVDRCEDATVSQAKAGNAGCDGQCAQIVRGIFLDLMRRAAKRSSSRRRRAG